MAITAPDIKLLESERMTDTTDGGGRRTSRVIPDGVAGNIFPKVSRLDSVYGRVNLRKVYGAVQTADVDTYAGAHAVITDAPDNDKIHTTLFSTANEFDTRTAARDRIESYVTSGPESRMVLVGRQLPGQQTINVYQRTEEPLPEIGDVYCLSNEAGSVVTTQQYIRISTIESEVRNYTDEKGDFQRLVVTIGIGVALRYEFNGPETPSRVSNVARQTRLRETTVVDAARYFGIKPLALAAAANDLTVMVSSVYTPIVPTTNRETPVSNASTNGAANLIAAAPAANITETLTAFGTAAVRYTRRAITPGSLTISGGGVTPLTDDKLGNISNATFVAEIDYESGTITRTGGSVGAVEVSATYQPAAKADQTAHTKDIPITIANRGTVYTFALNPLPSPGSTFLDYRALGKWYRLRDDGAGHLSGLDAAYGVGAIDYATGAVVVTLGALPDVSTSVILSWGSPVHYVVRAGATSTAATSLTQTFALPELPISPNSVGISYVSSGVTYTATDDASGAIAGNGVTGQVNYTSGEVTLNFTTRIPDALSSVSVTYDKLAATTLGQDVVRSLVTVGGASIALSDSVATGSLVASIPFAGKSLYVKDNGAGLLLVSGGQALGAVAGLTGAVVDGDQVIGSINYSTGLLSINTAITIAGNVFTAAIVALTDDFWGYEYYGTDPAGSGTWSQTSGTISVTTGTANVGWKSSGISTTLEAKTAAIQFGTHPLRLNMAATIGDSIVPGSLLFTLGGKSYIDRNGSLYADVSTTTAAGTPAGTVDYASGEVSLSHWANGAALAISVQSCLSTYGEYTTSEVFFRTAGAPLRPGSFYVQATTTAGTLVSGSAALAGAISGTKVDGGINADTGVVQLRFGQMVTAAGNESAYWYDAANIVGGMIWKPEFIIPSTLAYSCVVLANLPLNADILGLDPVRLPSDGRVPIYRPADVVVIHNTGAFTLPNPVVANAVYNVGRTNLSEVWLVDQAGVKVNPANYIYNLLNGTVTMAAALSLPGLVQPLIAKHRVEDLALLSDVQINGQLTLSAPLSRAYGTDSFVSSALLFGDMNARVENVFDIGAFSAWSNIAGSGATSQYNDIDYPIEVLNNGALGERWRISFTSTNAFQVVGENLGIIATGNTANDCSPTNALTGNPYFVIRAAGWGTGWSAGNQLRFNTLGAAAPIWIARTVLPGATLEGDQFSIQVRGDVDA